MNDYSDIIDIKNWNPKNHIRMPKENRAAQFSPFAALTGYEDELKEVRRVVDEKKIIHQDKQKLLNNKLIIIKNNEDKKVNVKITYFSKDLKKSGGFYRTITSNIKKIDLDNKNIILLDNKKISFDDIYDIDFC
jgi:hypothetical protein